MHVIVSAIFIACTVLTFQSATGQESKPAPDRAALASKAQQAFETQDWEQAVTQYRALVKLDEKNAVAWHHLGYALHSLQRLDEALEAHLKAAEFPRTRPMGFYNAGCVHALKKDKDKAFDYLMKAAAAGFGQVEGLDADTDLVGLHDDPRWPKLVEAVKNAEDGRGGLQVFSNPSERRASRVVWFGSKGSPGQVAVSFGSVNWKDEYEKHATSPRAANKRWRLGKDFWTTLDTNIDVTIGDKKVVPGDYYLTLERRDTGEFVLALNPAAAVRTMRLDAFQAGQTKGGTEIVMKHEKASEAAPKLEVALSVAPDDQTKGALTIRFGPHTLSAPVTYHLAEK